LKSLAAIAWEKYYATIQCIRECTIVDCEAHHLPILSVNGIISLKWYMANYIVYVPFGKVAYIRLNDILVEDRLSGTL